MQHIAINTRAAAAVVVVVDTMEDKAHTTQHKDTGGNTPRHCSPWCAQLVVWHQDQCERAHHTHHHTHHAMHATNRFVRCVHQLAPHLHIAHLLTWFGVDGMDGVAWHGDKEWQSHTVVVVVIDHGTKCVEAQAYKHATPQTPPSNTFDNIVCVLAWCSQGGLVGL